MVHHHHNPTNYLVMEPLNHHLKPIKNSNNFNHTGTNLHNNAAPRKSEPKYKKEKFEKLEILSPTNGHSLYTISTTTSGYCMQSSVHSSSLHSLIQ
jgi:hypothetical protein